MGYYILTFTQLWLVYNLTKSTVYLGAVGGVNGAANMCLSLFGGVLADRVNKRRLITITQSTMALLAFALATLTVTNAIHVWHVLIIAGLTGATSAFDMPARQALVPHLIEDPKHLTNAVALTSSVWSGSRIVGPAIAGVLVAATGPAVCFYITFFGYGIMVLSLTQINVAKSAVSAVKRGVVSQFKEGLDYIRRSGIFSSLIAMTFLNSIFGMSFVYLLPVFAQDILGVGSTGYGFLMSAEGTGAIIGVMTVATLGSHKHRGKLLLAGSCLFGALLILFSFSRTYVFSLLLLATASFCNSLYMTNVLTLLQTLVPDELRGRVMGIYSLTWSLMPLGGMQAGLVANFVGAPHAVAIGAVVILGFAVFITASSKRIRGLS